jgi:peptidoglycan/xylan/chitin deacetylase (PgdA/CDA1 family)
MRIYTVITALTLLVLLSLIPAHFNDQYAMAQRCDQSLWRHVYQPKRLTVIDICKAVSGTIVNHMRMADGDFHVRVKLDPQFENILKPSNYAQQDGYLVVEPICQTPPRESQAAPFCENFHQNINIPPDGTHVSITGSYVLDEEQDKWAEIHPVTSIVNFGSSSSPSPSSSSSNSSNSSSPSSSSSSSNSCPPCVIFRIDDVSDSHASSSIAVMKLFLAENKPLTLGIVMNHTGRNPALVEKILEGKNKGLFELALHGYDHVYYNKLSPQEQLNQLYDANQRMHDLFGKSADVFIPPYDVFNNYTIDAMAKLGIRIISAGDWDYGAEFGNSQYKLFYANDVAVDDKDNDPSKDNNNSQVIHIPRDAGFESFDAPQPTLVPIKQILNETNSHIQIFGYSVIVMHPESFQVMQNGKYTKTVDDKEINNLKTLIDSVKSKNIHITSFSKAASPILNS